MWQRFENLHVRSTDFELRAFALCAQPVSKSSFPVPIPLPHPPIVESRCFGERRCISEHSHNLPALHRTTLQHSLYISASGNPLLSTRILSMTVALLPHPPSNIYHISLLPPLHLQYHGIGPSGSNIIHNARLPLIDLSLHRPSASSPYRLIIVPRSLASRLLSYTNKSFILPIFSKSDTRISISLHVL